jgi:hypothetical protein
MRPVRAAAVVAAGEGVEAQLVAFLQCAPGDQPTLLELKAPAARECRSLEPAQHHVRDARDVAQMSRLDLLERNGDGEFLLDEREQSNGAHRVQNAELEQRRGPVEIGRLPEQEDSAHEFVEFGFQGCSKIRVGHVALDGVIGVDDVQR